jgi:hypothetical protein
MFDRTKCWSRYCIIPVNSKDNFFLNSQPDAPIIQIYSVIKLWASSLQSSSILTLLGNGHQKPA